MGPMLKFEGDKNEFVNSVKGTSMLCGNENWFEEPDCFDSECLVSFECFLNIVRALDFQANASREVEDNASWKVEPHFFLAFRDG